MDDGENTLDLFDVDDPGMDLDPDPASAPLRPAPARFKPKLKGKIKGKQSASTAIALVGAQELGQSKSTALASIQELGQSTSTALALLDPDEEDEVVREIDVFCNPLDEDAQLHVLQYPLRTSWRPYELEERCEVVKVNPKTSEVELVLRMDVDSENYDRDVPEIMRLQKQILSSSRATSAVKFATGILIKNELHLSHVHEVLQFRPSMNHIDDSELQKKGKTQEVGDKSDKPWVSLEYNPMGSIFSCKYQQKMLTEVTEQNYNMNFMMNSSEYVNSLCPGSRIKMKTNVPSSSFLPSLSLEERLKEWLRKGRQVNRFDALMHLDSTSSEEDFLKMLERFAFLVQGLWVSKSSLIYEGHESQLRDYILFLFSQNHVIKERQLKVLKITDTELREFLRPLARERHSLNDWKFGEERDSSFIRGHTDIVKEQEFAWSTRGKHLTEYISKPGRHHSVLVNSSAKPNTTKKKPSAHRVDIGSNRSNDRPGSSVATSMSNESRESLKKALLHIFHDRKARSINTLRRELRDLALSMSSRPKEQYKTKALVSAITITASSPLPDFLSVLREVAAEVHNMYVLRSGENPALDPLRDVVLGLLCSKGSDAKLMMHEIVDAAKATLNTDASEKEYIQVVKEFCELNQGAWVLRVA